METKKKNLLPIIVAVLAVIIGLIVFIILNANGAEKKLYKHLDLGNKYLNEEDYERAIAEFTTAIQIDPKSPEAYLGLANAYIGLSDYESAKSTLENGIESLNKASNTDDASQLQKKLDELQATLDAKNNVVEEISENVAEEWDKEILEDEQLQLIEIKPLIDSANLDNLWGRNWLDWTAEDFISTYGLVLDSSIPDARMYFNDDGTCQVQESDGCAWLNKRVYLYEYHEKTETLFIAPNNTTYCYLFEDIFEAYYDDTLSKYLIENDLTTYEGAKKYFGIDDSSEDSTFYEINTDNGMAMLSLYRYEFGDIQLTIQFVDESDISNVVIRYGTREYDDVNNVHITENLVYINIDSFT